MKWISVKDKLPKELEECLFYSSTVIRGFYFEDDFHSSSSDLIYEVTHWMPLPESPKKDGAE